MTHTPFRIYTLRHATATFDDYRQAAEKAQVPLALLRERLVSFRAHGDHQAVETAHRLAAHLPASIATLETGYGVHCRLVSL